MSFNDGFAKNIRIYYFLAISYKKKFLTTRINPRLQKGIHNIFQYSQKALNKEWFCTKCFTALYQYLFDYDEIVH